jgi:homopolymeric O-antigen transport system ATP-binding protein
MSEQPAILTQGLSKRYELGTLERFATFRDTIVRAVGAPVRALRERGHPKPSSSKASIWALHDVSIEIPEGDVVGFIGRNGAGKSTLLKIISRITAPTAGHVEIYGRVGALLEVGTGFHPELTGRENIFLNGAILGMTRAETRRKLDAIIDFSGVETFLETPVKRFSSGMQVRLAFSVAAHLDPEILIVDEVLAVGDIEFQRKCLGKMGDFARDGRTVLFVSHNMGIIQSLCKRAVYLQSGEVVADGPVRDVVGHYLQTLEEAVTVDLLERTDRDPRSHQDVMLERIVVVGQDGQSLATGRRARFELDLTGVMRRLSCRIVLKDALGITVASFDSAVASPDDLLDHDHGSRFVCEIEQLPLVPGRYRVDVLARGGGSIQDGIEGAAFFHVESGTFSGRSIRTEDSAGPVAIEHRWTSESR